MEQIAVPVPASPSCVKQLHRALQFNHPDHHGDHALLRLVEIGHNGFQHLDRPVLYQSIRTGGVCSFSCSFIGDITSISDVFYNVEKSMRL